MGRVATTDHAADEAAVPAAVDHVPAAVSDALELLTAPPHLSSASWAVQTAVWADRRIDDDDAAVWVEEELRVIEAVEKVKAWADFQGLAALRRMREAVHEQVRAQTTIWSTSTRLPCCHRRSCPLSR